MAAAARRDGARRARARSRPTGPRSSPGRPGSWTSRPASTTCTCSRRKQPDLNWENPEVRQAVYAMMRWWLDRGVDGFRMDVINMISKDDRAAGRPAARRRPVRRRVGALHRRPADPRVPAASCTGRCWPTATALLTVGEMPGVTVEEARQFTDPARAEVDMVFQFEHVGLDQGATKWDMRPLRLRDLKASFGRWQAGLADAAGTASTGTTTTSRGRSRGSATTAEHRRARPSCSAPCCTCTAARRTSTRARSSA